VAAISSSFITPETAWLVDISHGSIRNLGLYHELSQYSFISPASNGCLEEDEGEVFIQRCEEGVPAQTWTILTAGD
jgi:hypothetical protein